MTDREKEILSKYTEDVKAIYGNSLRYVILYGSRARGDFREDSDYDILVLVDMDIKEARRLWTNLLMDVDWKYNEKYNMDIMSVIVNFDHFNKWVRAYPFYNNAWNEGVALYDSKIEPRCMTRKQNMDDLGSAHDLAMHRMELARDDLAVARQNFEQKNYCFASDRAYSAVYHSMNACLALKFKGFKSHGQAIGYFNKEFVRTGQFPVGLSQKINEAKKIHDACIYEDFFVVSAEETTKQIQMAAEFVDMAGKYVMSQT